jgi:hypothetical protein
MPRLDLKKKSQGVISMKNFACSAGNLIGHGIKQFSSASTAASPLHSSFIRPMLMRSPANPNLIPNCLTA